MSRTKVQKIVILAAMSAVVAFSILAVRLTMQKPVSAPQPDTQQSTVRTFDLEFQDSRLVSGPSRIKVSQNETVKLRVTADTKDSLHLHGYDKKLELEPGKTVETTFLAGMTGSFKAELHTSESPVFVLEVYPR